MVDNVQRSKGRPGNYKLDRGGVPSEFGPFTGVVMSTVDPTRSGRLRVYIEAFADGGEAGMENDAKWTTVSYMPPFYGNTPKTTTNGATLGLGGQLWHVVYSSRCGSHCNLYFCKR